MDARQLAHGAHFKKKICYSSIEMHVIRILQISAKFPRSTPSTPVMVSVGVPRIEWKHPTHRIHAHFFSEAKSGCRELNSDSTHPKRM